MRFAAYFNSAGLVNSAALLPLPTLTPASVVDILVVAFLIYQALMIVKGTRAGHILIGILIMVALYVVALYTAPAGNRGRRCGPSLRILCRTWRWR